MGDSESESETTHLLNNKPTTASGRASYTETRTTPALRNSTHEISESKAVHVRHRLSIFDAHEAVALTWKNITVTASPKRKGLCASCRGSDVVAEPPKQILRDVSGVAAPGTLLAIMGASGAGKTTLMNTLTRRNLAALHVDGSVLVNGEELGRDIAAVSAYVRQEDMLIGTLTVHEHLWFQAMLRMDKHISTEVRKHRVSAVMMELSLTKCADTVIGTPGRIKGISGGERKRVAFGSELLTNPALLFCDEPTSGLDSFMAQNVVATLKETASRGKTILCTIHQPSSEVYAMFDKVLLLAEGRVAYMGTAKNALTFFESTGHPCPENFNPADFFITTLAIQPGSEEECKQTVEDVCNAFGRSSQFEEIQEGINAFSIATDSRESNEIEIIRNQPKYKANWFKQFRWVLWRCWLANARDPMLTRVRIAQTVVIGLLFGLIYLRQDYDQESIMNINGALFLLQLQMTMGNVFPVITTFPLEYPIFLKEHHDGMYRVDVYYLCKIISEAPIFLLLPILFVSITYWMIGLNPDWAAFLKAGGALLLVANVAMSFGYIVSTSTSNLNVAMSIAPVLLMPFVLFGGFMINSKSVPVYFIWLQYASWFNYCNEILIVNQWQGIHNITCSVPDYPDVLGAYPSHCFTDGSQIIASYNFNPDHLLRDFLVLVGLVVAFRLTAFILLFIRSMKKD